MINIKRNLSVLIALLLFAAPAIANAQVSVIANKSVSSHTADISALRNLYLLQSSELGSQKVKLFFLTAETETNKTFLKNMDKSFQELKKIWLRAKLTGNGAVPEFVSSEKEMLEKVASTPNAIGFIDSKSAPENVKVIATLR
ncbi:MAG TPA: hypothetical protein VHO28_00230 [Ignavibacteriales bacterium]|nr:hypothetical protein [Ignavibacteriales bacterium]